MLFGALAGLSGLLVHLLLPESLRYLSHKGHTEQLNRENSLIHLEEDLMAPVVIAVSPANGQVQDTPVSLWSRKFARITASLWILWMALNFLYQGVYVWLPTLLSGGDTSVSRSYLITLFISLGQLPGTFLVAYLADRHSRRNLLILSQGLVGLAAILFPLFSAAWWVMLVGFLIMLFNGMSMGLGHPFTTELYPTSIRARANGWASGIGRLGGVLAPLVVGLVMQAGGGLIAIFALLAGAPITTMAVLAGLKQETTGRSLEEIAEQEEM
ncbi:MAG: hypothetical protein C0391_00915 [Anaerolinea sp.]|nr:hypothetical protein [Anaerolinea sp.]